MILDKVIKQWCSENYDQSKEENYVRYAKYVAAEPWVKGLKKHTVFLWVAFILVFMTRFQDPSDFGLGGICRAALETAGYMGVLVTAFGIYGLKKYNLGDGTTIVFYVMMVVALNVVYGKLPYAVQMVFAIIMLPVSFLLHYVVPFRFRKTRKEMKQFHDAEEKEAEDLEKQREREEFDRWSQQRNGYPQQEEFSTAAPGGPQSMVVEEEFCTTGYNHGYRERAEQSYGYGGNNQDTEFAMESARALFEGFDTDRETLKDRYRYLVKRFHPDSGGDEELMKCINAVYDELCRKVW